MAPYKEALLENGFQPHAGIEAQWQPADFPDALLREHVWHVFDMLFKKHPSKAVSNVRDNKKVFSKLFKQCQAHINAQCDVTPLRKSFPSMVSELKAAMGDHLKY